MASFFNVWSQRIGHGKSLGGRSACPRCSQKLKTLDLIPVFSWIFLLGRCRYCHKKISQRYLLVELAMGFVFVLIAWHLNSVSLLTEIKFLSIWSLAFTCFVACFLLAVFLVDLKHFIIPDRFLWFLLGGILVNWMVLLVFKQYDWGDILVKISSGLGFFGLFFLIFIMSKGKWLGFGDIKYFLVVGLLLGLKGFFVMIFLASFIGALVGILQIIFLGKNLKSKLPFGVFLAPATLVAYLWGTSLLDYIFNFYLYI